MQTLFESTCAQSVLLYVPLPQNGCSKDDLTVLDMLAAGMSEGEAIKDFFPDKMNANFECSQQSIYTEFVRETLFFIAKGTSSNAKILSQHIGKIKKTTMLPTRLSYRQDQ